MHDSELKTKKKEAPPLICQLACERLLQTAETDFVAMHRRHRVCGVGGGEEAWPKGSCTKNGCIKGEGR